MVKLITCLVVAALPGPLAAEEILPSYNKLSALKTDVELPDESSGSAASIHRSLRPALTYPTLNVRQSDHSPSAEQPSQEGPPGSKPALTGGSFTKLVEQTLGEPLEVFGADLFQQPEGRYTPIDQVNVPTDFVIGPGDELHIQAWGSVEIDARLIVRRNGSITLPKIGEISVAGVRYRRLEAHITAALRRAYHSFELSVALGRLRSIRIYVTGFAAAPGSYTVNSLSTLINAIFLSGGPAASGDPRRIELHRAGRTVTTLDLYQFLIDGARPTDVRLQPEDTIYVPPIVGQAAIAGGVHRAAIFHITPQDTLQELLDYAGGLSPNGSHRVVLERFQQDGQRFVEEFALTDATLSTPVRAGDLVLVKSASPQFRNAVTLRGHVAQPLRHKWQPGMTVSDLLPDAQALISPQYWQQRNAEDQVADLVKSPTELAPQINFPDINWEYAAIERVQRETASATLIPVNLRKAVLERIASEDIALQPGDILTVFAIGDFRAPVSQTRHLVSVEGEVTRAGLYPVSPNDTIPSLVARAGGITGEAYLPGMEFSREAVRARQQQRMHEAIDRLDEDYQRHLIDRSRNVLSGDLSMAIHPEAAAIAALVSRLRAAEPTGRIVIELDRLGSRPQVLPEISLRNGDRIYIPPRPATVEVVGAVLQSGSTLHQPGRRVSDYLTQSGLISTADRREIYLVRPNGAFKKAKLNQTLLPGDTIVVPEKVERQAAVRRLKDWTQVLYQFGLGAAGLAILKDL